MVLCPIALAVGCKKCPIFAVCPVKSTLGDYKKDEPAPPVAKPRAGKKSPAKKR
nr:hypothetical protein [uncultured Roseateles sp.]